LGVNVAQCHIYPVWQDGSTVGFNEFPVTKYLLFKMMINPNITEKGKIR